MGLDNLRFLSVFLDPGLADGPETSAVRNPDSLLEAELDLVFSGESQLSGPLAGCVLADLLVELTVTRKLE